MWYTKTDISKLLKGKVGIESEGLRFIDNLSTDSDSKHNWFSKQCHNVVLNAIECWCNGNVYVIL